MAGGMEGVELASAAAFGPEVVTAAALGLAATAIAMLKENIGRGDGDQSAAGKKATSSLFTLKTLQDEIASAPPEEVSKRIDLLVAALADAEAGYRREKEAASIAEAELKAAREALQGRVKRGGKFDPIKKAELVETTLLSK